MGEKFVGNYVVDVMDVGSQDIIGSSVLYYVGFGMIKFFWRFDFDGQSYIGWGGGFDDVVVEKVVDFVFFDCVYVVYCFEVGQFIFGVDCWVGYIFGFIREL